MPKLAQQKSLASHAVARATPCRYRFGTGTACGARHDRDLNAAINRATLAADRDSARPTLNAFRFTGGAKMKRIAPIECAIVLFLECFVAPDVIFASSLGLGKPVTLEGAFANGSGYLGYPLPPLPPPSIMTSGSMQDGYRTNDRWLDKQNLGVAAGGIGNRVITDRQGNLLIKLLCVTIINIFYIAVICATFGEQLGKSRN